MVNQQPWLNDAAHAAMLQPAGPELTAPSKDFNRSQAALDAGSQWGSHQ
jgi:hypothetical protein